MTKSFSNKQLNNDYMKLLKIDRETILEAGKRYARSLVGENVPEGYEASSAYYSAIEDFKSGVEWAFRQHIAVHPDDAAHELIAKERLAHADRGFDAKHDEQYKNSELAVTAVAN
jgi:hypothetical protein